MVAGRRRGQFGGLLRDIDEGYAKRIAIVIPPGAVWPLPAYELALMTAGEARAMGHYDVRLTVVTPEPRPLDAFGEDASRAVAEELRARASRRRRDRRATPLAAAPPDVQRVIAVPRLAGPALAGLATDDEGFILTGDDGLVEGAERTWAVGDGVASPVKFGALATHQARVAAAAVARLAGATVPTRASRSSTAAC